MTNKSSFYKKSNDLLNRITLFFVGMMTNGIVLLTFMKILQLNGLIISILAIFLLNTLLYRQYKTQSYLKAFNLGLLVANIIFVVFALILAIAFFSVLNQIFH